MRFVSLYAVLQSVVNRNNSATQEEVAKQEIVVAQHCQSSSSTICNNATHSTNSIRKEKHLSFAVDANTIHYYTPEELSQQHNTSGHDSNSGSDSNSSCSSLHSASSVSTIEVAVSQVDSTSQMATITTTLQPAQTNSSSSSNKQMKSSKASYEKDFDARVAEMRELMRKSPPAKKKRKRR